ncbi:MAG: RluA family pseudouridine synthase [Puniceicoccales bacterium]
MDDQAWETRYPLGDGVRVLAVHPAGLIALEKPVGVLSHPNGRRDKHRSLVASHYDHETERYYDLPEAGDELYLCHRLDSATSGVILLAQNPEMAQTVRELFSTHRMEKHYHAIVRGRPPAQENWVDRMSPAAMPYSGKPGGHKTGGGRPVEMRCRMHFVKNDANRLGLSLLQLIPATGRTHQLRIQTSKRGFPILGDRTYGDFRLNRTIAQALDMDRLYLHAGLLAFDFLYEGKLQKFRAESPLPDEFQQIMGGNAKLSRLKFNLPGVRPSRVGVPHVHRHHGSGNPPHHGKHHR